MFGLRPEGPGGCGEASVGGHALGAGDLDAEIQALLSHRQGEGAGGLQGESRFTQSEKFIFIVPIVVNSTTGE